ncbi:MAG TPA: riboflavin synthase [Chitinophagaceae bacterium]|nr:riboflavin synthase [Chitinophagaceae bacterium]
MFTGIIEALGTVVRVEPSNPAMSFWIESPISSELQVDQSLSHDGVCLTVEEISGTSHRVTAVRETLKKSILGNWAPGYRVNLERSLRLGDRLDGHLVQGHVDGTAACLEVARSDGDWQFRFRLPARFSRLLVEKGSIAVNGVSLTAFEVRKKSFRVAVIPFTLEHTNLRDLKVGQKVNLEFDMVGKYLSRFTGKRK